MTELNYFESEYYKILLYKNKYNDKFNFNIENNKIFVKRIDAYIGWGQDLKLLVHNKNQNIDSIINVGSSENNTKEIDFIVENFTQKNHYEDDKIKIFYISKQFNDIFSIDYKKEDNILYIERIDNDKNDGWGQDLHLKYIDKEFLKEKIIHVGKSNKNKIFMNINLNKIKYINNHNFYESSNFKISLFNNKFEDLFEIFFFEENNTIYIKRLDVYEGWGQDLMLNVFDLNQNYNFIIYIGPSKNNEIYKKIDLKIRKTFVSLTTIPSRIKLPIFIENVKDILNNQTYNIEYLFITIPNKYRRFEEVIEDDIFDKLRNLPKVILINIKEDLGPASKYLGPLMNYYQLLKDNILVVIDDDRVYGKNLIRNFNIGYNSFPNIKFSSGLWSYYFDKNYKNIDEDFLEYQIHKEYNNNKFFYGQGLGGFFGFSIKVENIEPFINYNLKILERIPKSFFHDEGIILGYLKYKEETILYLKHIGCNIIEHELVDALCTSNLVNRGNVEKEILRLTNLEKIN